MRIALIASLLESDTHGGAEAYVEAAARSLAGRHDVVILTGSKQASVDGLPLVRLPRLPQFSPGSRGLGARVVWHARDQWRPKVHAALVRELKRISPDVVASHHPQGLSAAVFTAIAARRLAHVHTAHDLNVLCARTSMTRNGRYCGGHCAGCLVQRGIRGGALRLDVSALIGVSRYICQRHVDARVVPEERAVTIRLGADAQASRLRRLTGEPTIGFIGTLAPHKGIQTALAALALTDAKWKLHVAGVGPLAHAVEEAARRDARITYHGLVEGATKEAFYESLDLLVIPSEWEEPATLVAAEACVRGIPCVVSARGGLPEWPHSRTFPSGDARALLEALEWFTADPERVSKASAALLAMRNEFTWETHIGRVEDVLEAAGT